MRFAGEGFRAFARAGAEKTREIGTGFSGAEDAKEALAEFWAEEDNAVLWPEGLIWRWGPGDEDLDADVSVLALKPWCEEMGLRIAKACARKIEFSIGDGTEGFSEKGI